MFKRAPRTRRQRRQRRLENLETRTLMAADLMRMHNPVEAADVNNDGNVRLDDALLTVQEIRRVRNGEPGGNNNFTDVNNDGNVTLTDALMVVERLRRSRPGDGPQDGNPEAPQPPRPPESASIDGTGNNVDNPEWGSTEEAFLRITTPEYGDGISSPAGEDRLSAREISNLVFTQDEANTNDRGLTALVWQWGQFIDHDITLTHNDSEDPLDIAVPEGDVWFDPTGSGTETIGFSRSTFDPETGDAIDNVREQVNSITAFLDGSMIYGSDADTAAALREGAGGRMLVSEGDLLPIDPNSGMFMAGDIRANEQPGLTAMHTLFVREHNQQAERIAGEHPDWTDEQVFQAARRIVVGEIQAITYNEFLPALLGRELPEYRGYRADVDPGISNIFATAGYRFGHSMVSSTYDLVDNSGELIESLSLAEAFFDPSILQANGIDSALKGLTEQQSQEIDTEVVDELRNLLFGPPGSGGLDLVALNIQRGRDHGLADYNQAREDMGLERVETFADINSDPVVQAELAAAYDSVDEIDVWVGILSEEHRPGSSMGELGSRVMVDQFLRLRDGDRFYYENAFSGNQLRRIDSTRLSDIIERNTDLTDLDRNVFVDRDAIDPSDLPGDGNPDRPHRPGDDGPRDRDRDRLAGEEGSRGDGPGDDGRGGDEQRDRQLAGGDRGGPEGQRPDGPGGEGNRENSRPPLGGPIDPAAADELFAQL